MRASWYVPLRFPRLARWDAMPASVWIRCLQLLPYLRELGVTSALNPRRAGPVAFLVRRPDEVALEQARALKARGCRVVLDLCVNYFDPTPVVDGAGVLPEQADRCRRLCELVDAVTTASAEIARRAAAHHGRVRYLADSVDPRHFGARKAMPPGPPRAIWCGVAVKAGELRPILPALAELGIPLTVVADRPPALPVARFLRWRWRRAPRDLLAGEVCVAPRALDTPYNLGHSHFKVGVFLAQGVPVLASPVPSYREVVQDGVTGRLIERPDDWRAALAEVATRPETLAAWGAAAPAAMAPYATPRVAAGYRDLIAELAGER